ncbi:LAMI_0B05424g1_1 [Lachancea mirantina]|uniref:LAMI_0B05424g1_1 n=1 Tax=Lachancea mirantina TaxID=1230905 RepID=A0A1G4IWH0_9SACH|nr:LAMI_0B05424g1_1 [Lachancea mirantina]
MSVNDRAVRNSPGGEKSGHITVGLVGPNRIPLFKSTPTPTKRNQSMEKPKGKRLSDEENASNRLLGLLKKKNEERSDSGSPVGLKFRQNEDKNAGDPRGPSRAVRAVPEKIPDDLMMKNAPNENLSVASAYNRGDAQDNWQDASSVLPQRPATPKIQVSQGSDDTATGKLFLTPQHSKNPVSKRTTPTTLPKKHERSSKTVIYRMKRRNSPSSRNGSDNIDDEPLHTEKAATATPKKRKTMSTEETAKDIEARDYAPNADTPKASPQKLTTNSATRPGHHLNAGSTTSATRNSLEYPEETTPVRQHALPRIRKYSKAFENVNNEREKEKRGVTSKREVRNDMQSDPVKSKESRLKKLGIKEKRYKSMKMAQSTTAKPKQTGAETTRKHKKAMSSVSSPSSSVRKKTITLRPVRSYGDEPNGSAKISRFPPLSGSNSAERARSDLSQLLNENEMADFKPQILADIMKSTSEILRRPSATPLSGNRPTLPLPTSSTYLQNVVEKIDNNLMLQLKTKISGQWPPKFEITTENSIERTEVTKQLPDGGASSNNASSELGKTLFGNESRDSSFAESKGAVDQNINPHSLEDVAKLTGPNVSSHDRKAPVLEVALERSSDSPKMMNIQNIRLIPLRADSPKQISLPKPLPLLSCATNSADKLEKRAQVLVEERPLVTPQLQRQIQTAVHSLTASGEKKIASFEILKNPVDPNKNSELGTGTEEQRDKERLQDTIAPASGKPLNIVSSVENVFGGNLTEEITTEANKVVEGSITNTDPRNRLSRLGNQTVNNPNASEEAESAQVSRYSAGPSKVSRVPIFNANNQWNGGQSKRSQNLIHKTLDKEYKAESRVVDRSNVVTDVKSGAIDVAQELLGKDKSSLEENALKLKGSPLRPDSGQLKKAQQVDPEREQKRAERAVGREIQKNVASLKCLKKTRILELIQMGIVNHTPFEGGNNVTVSNNICNINNYEISPVLYLQHLSKKGRLTSKNFDKREIISDFPVHFNSPAAVSKLRDDLRGIKIYVDEEELIKKIGNSNPFLLQRVKDMREGFSKLNAVFTNDLNSDVDLYICSPKIKVAKSDLKSLQMAEYLGIRIWSFKYAECMIRKFHMISEPDIILKTTQSSNSKVGSLDSIEAENSRKIDVQDQPDAFKGSVDADNTDVENIGDFFSCIDERLKSGQLKENESCEMARMLFDLSQEVCSAYNEETAALKNENMQYRSLITSLTRSAMQEQIEIAGLNGQLQKAREDIKSVKEESISKDHEISQLRAKIKKICYEDKALEEESRNLKATSTEKKNVKSASARKADKASSDIFDNTVLRNITLIKGALKARAGATALSSKTCTPADKKTWRLDENAAQKKQVKMTKATDNDLKADLLSSSKMVVTLDDKLAEVLKNLELERNSRRSDIERLARIMQKKDEQLALVSSLLQKETKKRKILGERLRAFAHGLLAQDEDDDIPLNKQRR